MHRRPALVIVFAAVVTILAAPAAAAGNQSPTAAAGLDQSVTVGTTVFLDAGGSADADGEITATEWSVRAPNGSTVTPSCRACATPTFTPDATGRWAVTVTVTDDDGATASDTLYVTVGEPRGPAITMGAPDTTTPAASTPIVVETASEERALRRVEVYHDGTRVDRFDVSGERSSVTARHAFDTLGTKELLAVATDEDGYVTTKTMTVEVVSRSGGEAAGGGGGGGGSTGTTSSGSFGSGGGDGECDVWRVGNKIHHDASCDGDVTYMSLSDDSVEAEEGDDLDTTNQLLTDANGDGDFSVTVESPKLDGGEATISASKYTDISDHVVESGGDTLVVDKSSLESAASQNYLDEVESQNDNNDGGSASGGSGGSSDSSNSDDRYHTVDNPGSSDSGSSSSVSSDRGQDQTEQMQDRYSDNSGSSSGGSDNSGSSSSGGHSGPYGPGSSYDHSSPPDNDSGLITDDSDDSGSSSSTSSDRGQEQTEQMQDRYSDNSGSSSDSSDTSDSSDSGSSSSSNCTAMEIWLGTC